MQAQLWDCLLQLASQLKALDSSVLYCGLSWEEAPLVCINTPLPETVSTHHSAYLRFEDTVAIPSGFAVLELAALHQSKVIFAGQVAPEALTFLEMYLPYCCLPLAAHRLQRAVSVAHLAQSLDGKIATHCGDSRWIGNPENLDHAHRMRALCEGIIVGAKTVFYDSPRLTVRRVKGPNPQKVVVGNSAQNFSSLLQDEAERLLLIGTQERAHEARVDYHQLVASNGHIQGQDILACLYQAGIHSVYVEGGAITVSNFLNDQAIDILQLHLAPCLFGSGKQGIVLPQIDQVAECIRFDHFAFQRVGDSIMFVGEPRRQKKVN